MLLTDLSFRSYLQGVRICNDFCLFCCKLFVVLMQQELFHKCAAIKEFTYLKKKKKCIRRYQSTNVPCRQKFSK